MEWKKSNLQSRLEAEGWEFMGNENIADYDLDNGLSALCWVGGARVTMLTRHQLTDSFRKRYREVRLEQAYDSEGKPVATLREFTAVYVRGRISQTADQQR